MFNWIKSWFVTDGGTLFNEGTRDMTATIIPTTNGKYGLVTRTGEFVGTYSRQRDAVRGAKRRGFEVA